MSDNFERLMAGAAKILFSVAVVAFVLTLLFGFTAAFNGSGSGIMAVLTAAIYAGAMPFFGAALLWRLDKIIEKRP
jgi:predicted branched-subunit amino acid permease